ncbi:alpha/beta hydrolase family protein [Congregibacter litoralis]|uniref:AB hydrolase-1 domain-containing protein n=1 Tax=Congregibacter litoralis KT71 TaxID=314285 RepID=A4ABD2_9GAMM|nr:alpha/beta hydrolase family protein [Congregibacter litoralis]EAQ96686.2 hypothetical protein KT71_06674 [Congregibacter litoralis KT71]
MIEEQKNQSAGNLESRRPLVLIIHGVGGPRILSSVQVIVKRAYPSAEILLPRLPHRRVFSFDRLSDAVADLVQLLNDQWHEHYSELVIIGHSAGGPLARAVYLAGEKNEAPWAKSLQAKGRIVMLAGMNRGWQISHHLSIGQAIAWSFGSVLGHALSLFGLPPILFDLRRGSHFLTRLRFEWLDRAQKHRMPLVVQLLGTIDDMVGPEDAIDLVTGENFRYLDVPFSGHRSVVEMSADREHGDTRAEVLQIALGPQAQIAEYEVRPWTLSQQIANRQHQETVEHVVFVIHGIRDRGFWTDKIARHIWRRCPAEQRGTLERVTASYGYLGMGPFMFPWVRRKKVEWLADTVLVKFAQMPGKVQ